MQWDGDLARFKSLIELFGHDNVVAVVPGQQEVHFPDIKIINRPKFKGYHIKFREYLTMISGIIIFLYYSIKVKINLFGVAYSILNSYFSVFMFLLLKTINSFFKNVVFDFLIIPF